MEVSSKNLLEVKNLSKRYLIKKQLFKKEFFSAVDKVSFYIKTHETVGLVGESGSGKSTIGKLILKLIPKDEGEIYFKGKEIYSFSKEEEKKFRRETSIVFQDPRTSLNPRFKIYEILEEPLIVHKIPKEERKKRVVQTIKDAGLDETFLDRYPSDLSGGQRQRVAIARAIILEPDLIVADEPTSALDVSVQLQIINLINRLKKEKKISFLFISHDLNVVGLLSERIIVLYKGKIMEAGDGKKVIKNPLHPYTKLLISSLPPDHPSKRKKLDYIPEVYREEIKGGCVFYSRCPIAQDICKKEPPVKTIDNREVYCHIV
ncbi:MAG: ABC transporter ATP-binding protein [Aquificae bacterium]|nr:ABC transporter ATP-binding protein [Aquificota bacterium]